MSFHVRVGRQGRLRARARRRPDRARAGRLRVPGRVPRAGGVRRRVRAVRRRAALERPNPGASDEARREIIAWQEWERPIGVLGAGSDALGGWTLDVHHSYDPRSHTLHTGDGTTVTSEAIRSEIRTALGKVPPRVGRRHAGDPRRRSGSRAAATPAADGSVVRRRARARPRLPGQARRAAAGRRGRRRAGDGIGDGGPALQAHAALARRRRRRPRRQPLHLRHRQRPRAPRRPRRDDQHVRRRRRRRHARRRRAGDAPPR